MLEVTWPYLVMLASAFGAATLLPLASEAVLIAEIKAGVGSKLGLFATAVVGNVGGSTLNWWLGHHVHRFQDRRWFPFSSSQMVAAAQRFKQWGIWSLLLAWLPVIGDPLTFAAGIFRVPIVPFLILVTIGKAARYAVIATWT